MWQKWQGVWWDSQQKLSRVLVPDIFQGLIQLWTVNKRSNTIMYSLSRYEWIWGTFSETSTFPNALMDTFAKFGTFCSLLYQVTKLLRQQLPLGSSIKYLLKDLSHFLSVPFLFWKSSEMPNIKRFSWEKEKRLTSWQIA